MPDAIDDIEKPVRGRPRTDSTPILVRLDPELLRAVDAWRLRRLAPKPSRPEAIRLLLRDKLLKA